MTESYWHRDAGWRDRWRDAEIPRRVDFAVIGGGLSGLATAIELRTLHPRAEIVVLEAARVGHGASGRNAGLLSPVAAPIWLLAADRDPDHAWATRHLHDEVGAIARWIAAHVPDAELQPATLRLAARGRFTRLGLREFGHALDHAGLAHDVSTDHAGAHLEMEAHTVHPYKLVVGLATHAEATGVRIREHARVQAIDTEPPGARIVLDDGTVVLAGRVVVCTNAYTAALDVGERIRALVVHSFLTATGPVAGTTTATRTQAFTVELNAAQTFHRMHGDHVLLGGHDQLRTPRGDDFAVPAGVTRALAAQRRERFPGPATGAPSEAWAGRFHATATGLPILRASARHPAVILNVGYGGTGVALTLALARLAASTASGQRCARDDDARLRSILQATPLSAWDATRAIARIARRATAAWRA